MESCNIIDAIPGSNSTGNQCQPDGKNTGMLIWGLQQQAPVELPADLVTGAVLGWCCNCAC